MKDQGSRTKEVQYLKKIRDVEFQPVFILGVHRSGTSILYKMLTATGCFNPVTAYHLIEYDSLLSNFHEQSEDQAKQQLTESFLKDGLRDRGIDRLKITADFAEEYGFLLGNRTPKMRITRQNVVLFNELCQKIQFIAGNHKPILLKNPYDFPNFLVLKWLFPNARFVFIHRHPLKTISSTLQAVRTILQEKNPYTARLSRTYNTCYSNPLLLVPLRVMVHSLAVCSIVALAIMTKQSTKYYQKNIGRLSKEEYISITYEDLCLKPQEILENIMEKLSLTAVEKVDAGTLMHPRTVEVDRTVQKLRSYIYKTMRAYFDCFHYSSEG